MAKINFQGIQDQKSKKVDLSDFFEGAYVRILRLSKRDKRLIEIYQMDSAIINVAMEKLNFDKLEKSGLDLSKDANFKKEATLAYLKTPAVEKISQSQAIEKMEEIYLNKGIDIDDHNLEDMEGNKIELTQDFWELVPEMAIYIINEIKKFNEAVIDYSLGEQIENKSIM